MNVNLDVQYAVSEEDGEPPSPELIRSWIKTALQGLRDEVELTVRIVSRDEIQQLNHRYRHVDKPTNVLSFPFEKLEGVDLPLLGDVVICAAVVEQEALQQNKPVLDHWAHMVVHGVLHLLGFDHVENGDAKAMESKEISILEELGITNPYEERRSQQVGH